MGYCESLSIQYVIDRLEILELNEDFKNSKIPTKKKPLLVVNKWIEESFWY